MHKRKTDTFCLGGGGIRRLESVRYLSWRVLLKEIKREIEETIHSQTLGFDLAPPRPKNFRAGIAFAVMLDDHMSAFFFVTSVITNPLCAEYFFVSPAETLSTRGFVFWSNPCLLWWNQAVFYGPAPSHSFFILGWVFGKFPVWPKMACFAVLSTQWVFRDT